MKVEAREDFGARLQARRDAAGLSGTEVAKRAGISATTYYAIENGKTTARSATLRRLARGFGVSVEELLTDTPLGRRSPLEQARVQAEKLKQREAEGGDKDDAFWGVQWAVAKACVDDTAKLLREVGSDEARRSEALDLLDEFIGLERRALERYLKLHGWSLENIAADDAGIEASNQ